MQLQVTIAVLIGATFCGRQAATLAAPADDSAGKTISVTASVQSNADAFIRAQQVPGPFTVPKGYRAVNFKYSFTDPSSGYTTDKLRTSNIRIVRGGVVGLNAGDKDFSLGPGDYLFTVGGLPGAAGSLSFTLLRSEDPTGGKDFADRERVIDVVVWSQQYPDQPKITAVYYVRDGQVRGELDYRSPGTSTGYWTSEPSRIHGTFTGTMTGNVITGKWNDVTDPHRMTWPPDGDRPGYYRIDSGKSSYENRVVLYADGTLSETCKGSGTTILDWGPTAPKDVAGKRETIPYDFAVPGENHTGPITGTWKNRN